MSPTNDTANTVQTPRTPDWLLRLVDGVHAGGECRLQPGALLLIGSHEDCDIVLAGDSVEPRHCILGINGSDVVLRTLDGTVDVDGRPLEVGSVQHVQAFQEISLGATTVVAVGPADADQWSRLRAPAAGSPAGMQRWLSTFSPVTAITSLVLIAAASLALSAFVSGPEKADEPALGIADVEALLRKLNLEEAGVSQGATGEIVIDGIVPDATAATRLRAELTALNGTVREEVRSGRDVANDVREVLRMSGIRGVTQYIGGGRVSVEAPFAERSLLASVIGSRAMLEIDHLDGVVVLDRPPAADEVKPSDGPPDGKKIVSVVAGADPYLVTADGSRYYVGAKLPGGGRLHAIEADAVWIDTGESIEKLEPQSTHVQRSST